jgi:penicillin-binding protein 2
LSSSPLPGPPFLPPDRRVEEPYRLTPRAAARIAIVGVIAVVLFAILFFRLWALQVIAGEKHLETAEDNIVRTYRIEPPRGLILDRNGQVLVTNAPGRVVELWPSYTEGRLDEVIEELSKLLDVPVKDIRRDVRNGAADPLKPIVIKTNVHDDKANYILEHRPELPGVEVARTQVRSYPFGGVAAHLLGSVGQINEEELTRLGAGYESGDRIGKGGIESAYDGYLRGEPGEGQIRFNSQNVPLAGPQPSQLPRAGYAVRLTIDADLQRAAERAIEHGIDLGRDKGNWAANGGAIIAMDPRDGAILAAATYPRYDPSLFAGRADPLKVGRLYDEEASAADNYPLLDRALAGTYPPGSTFKPVTALAALAHGLITPQTQFQCDGFRKIDGQTFDNWDPFVNEPMTLETALARSCDTYFYDVGGIFYKQDGSPLQDWARKMGFGKRPPLGVGQSNTGLVPTPAWLRETFANPIDQEWTTGDSAQLAIGQGHLTVTPLQMTRFYALLANGGLLVQPHVVRDIEQPGASQEEDDPVVLRSFEPRPPRDVGLPAQAIQIVQQGLYGATHDTLGTAAAIYAGYPIPIAGKTGTAEKYVELPVGYLGRKTPFARLQDHSWFCGYGPTTPFGSLDLEYGHPPLVVCALIEYAGHGGDAAAPAALDVFASYWGVAPPEAFGEVHSD